VSRTESKSSVGRVELLGRRIGIAKTLMLMLVVPIGGLLAFSSAQVDDRLERLDNMTQLEELTSLGIATSQLAHSLQRERGRTSIYLGSPDRDPAAMNEQRARTDEAAAAFEAAVARATGVHGDARRHVDATLRWLRDLGPFRNQANARTIDAVRGSQFYTDFLAEILLLMPEIVESASTASVALSLTALESLVRLKELAGQERAFGLAILSGANVTQERARSFRALQGRQIAFGDFFLAHAEASAIAEYRNVLASTHEAEVSRIRPIIFDRLARLQAPDPAVPGAAPAAMVQTEPVDPHLVDAYWTATTGKIDALFVVETLLETHLLEEVTTLREEARSSLIVVGLITALIVFFGLAIAFALGRGLIQAFTDVSDTLQTAVKEIGSFVREQSTSVSETAAAVSQTTTTIEEIRKTAETASARSGEMAGRSQSSRSASEKALKSISEGTNAMKRIRTEVEGIADGILELSEKNIQIGEIVTSVGSIAEQSNLLAVNASIEAAKAGEHGRGFSVVATEVKALALQSKQATHQIRSILQDVQKSSNSAVMVTEQGVKRVEEGATLIEDLGHAISDLRDDVDRNADSASQISLIASQQLAGIEQITDAMRNISVASTQNAAGAKRIEAAAEQVERVSARILMMVSESGARERTFRDDSMATT